jgi:hypothetical protein
MPARAFLREEIEPVLLEMGYRELASEDDGKVFYTRSQQPGEVVLDFWDGAIAYYILYPALEIQGLDVDRFRALMDART